MSRKRTGLFLALGTLLALTAANASGRTVTGSTTGADPAPSGNQSECRQACFKQLILNIGACGGFTGEALTICLDGADSVFYDCLADCC